MAGTSLAGGESLEHCLSTKLQVMHPASFERTGLNLTRTTGALAARGFALSDVVFAGKAVAEHVGTMGAALTTCSLPGQQPNARIAPDDIEMGKAAPCSALLVYTMLRRVMVQVLAFMESLGNRL